MLVLERKKDGTEVISVRVPRAINEKLIELRRRAHLLGFNFRHVGWSFERGGETDPPGLAKEESQIGGGVRAKRLPGAGGKAA